MLVVSADNERVWRLRKPSTRSNAPALMDRLPRARRWGRPTSSGRGSCSRRDCWASRFPWCCSGCGRSPGLSSTSRTCSSTWRVARSANWWGSPGTTDLLAAPHGTDWAASLPTGTERLHVALLDALDAITGNPFIALNAFVVIGVAATVVVGYAVLRWLGVGPLVAAAAASAFAMSPALTDRLGAGHLFLFSLYPVALGVYLAVWSTRWPARSLRSVGWSSWVLPGLAVVVIATSSIYYAVFTILIVAGVGVLRSIRAGDWRQLVGPGMITVALCLAVAVALVPDVLARIGASTAGGFSRSVQDSDSYGLRLAQMLLPSQSSRVPLLAALGERAYWVRGTGDYGVALGLAGVAGVVAVGWNTLRRFGRPRDAVDGTVGQLAGVIAVSVAVATVGGVGFMLATLGFTQVRVWSRLAAFIGFAAIGGLGLLVQRRWGSRSTFGLWVVALAALCIVEQPLPPSAASMVDRQFGEDQALVSSLRDSLPKDAAVAELPVVPFPTTWGPIDCWRRR